MTIETVNMMKMIDRLVSDRDWGDLSFSRRCETWKHRPTRCGCMLPVACTRSNNRRCQRRTP